MSLYICYVDESGCTGQLPSATSDIQPVFIVTGIIIESSRIQAITNDLLNLKNKFYPHLSTLSAHYLDLILHEIKGSDLRKALRTGNRREKSHAIGVMDYLFNILESNNVKIIGRVWTKAVGNPIDSKAIYTSTIQSICNYFNMFLSFTQSDGLAILDSRKAHQNTSVAHSIFTRMFRAVGNELPRLCEMPIFGHSQNHAGIQLSDLVCSAIVFPMTTYTYCSGMVNNVHVSPNFYQIKKRYGKRLSKLQYRYQENGKWYGGITVSDQLTQKSGSELFSP